MCNVYVDISNDGLDFTHELICRRSIYVGTLRTQMFIYIHIHPVLRRNNLKFGFKLNLNFILV